MINRRVARLLLVLLAFGLEPAGADPLLADFDYPHPVQRYEFTSQRQSLAMAFMDVRPAQPTAKASYCCTARISVAPLGKMPSGP